MFQSKPGTKQDPARRWALPDRAFFAHGACQILAGVHLRIARDATLWAERIVPDGDHAGNHIYVTDGLIAFDYRGAVARDRLLIWFRQSWSRIVPNWSGTVERVAFELLDTAALNARQMRGPDQYLHNPIPRARAFLATKR